MEEKDFPLERILTVSARDYMDSKLASLHNYALVGVHSNSSDVMDFSRKVPKNAEVVVDYRIFITGTHGTTHTIVSGTALIPKKQL